MAVASVAGHAMQTSPAVRPGLQGPPAGAKIQPFDTARATANAGCGGTLNRDPGLQQPTQAFTPGATVTVNWDLTIPHPDDNLASGIRVAIHYGPGDSFDQPANILAGGMFGPGSVAGWSKLSPGP